MFHDSVKMILKVSLRVADSVCENTNLMLGKRGFLQLHEQKLIPYPSLFPTWSSYSNLHSVNGLTFFFCTRMSQNGPNALYAVVMLCFTILMVQKAHLQWTRMNPILRSLGEFDSWVQG